MSTFYAYTPNHNYLGIVSAVDHAAAIMLAAEVYGAEILILRELLVPETAHSH